MDPDQTGINYTSFHQSPQNAYPLYIPKAEIDKVRRYLPCFLIIFAALAIMTIAGIITQRSLASENQKLKAELEELKKSFAIYMTKNGQALEELRSADIYLQIQLEKSNQSFETQMAEHEHAIEELDTKSKDLQRQLDESNERLETKMTNHEQAIEELRSKDQNFETRFDSLSENIKKDEETQAKQQTQLDELQSYTKSELTRVAHHESGRLIPHDPTPLHVVTDQYHDRCIRDIVKFEKPFSSPPRVIVGLSTIDASETTGLRLNIGAQNISVDGFELVACTWWNTIIGNYYANWFAYEV